MYGAPLVVIAGIGLVLGRETWNLPWLNYADALAGLAVAGRLFYGRAQLGKRRTLDALLDACKGQTNRKVSYCKFVLLHLESGQQYKLSLYQTFHL